MAEKLEELIQVKVNAETKELLEQWASEDGNRTVASIIRQLIEREKVRRMVQLSMPLNEAAHGPTAQMRATGAAALFPIGN